MKPALILFGMPAVVFAQGGKPLWVTQVPSEPGKVYGMGMAQIAPTEAMAIKQASNNAKGEVLSRLRATVKSSTDIRQTMTEQRGTNTKTTATGTRSFDQATSVQASATDLPGLNVAQTWTDRKENIVYALAYLDVMVAERELRTRFDALQNDLVSANTEGEARERLRKLRRLQEAQKEAAKLDDIAGLLGAGGGDPALRADVRKVKLWVDKLLDDLRASLTFCMVSQGQGGGMVGSKVGDLVRNAVLKAGLGWAEQGGEFTLKLDLRGSRSTYANEFHTTWGTLDVTLVDRAGTQYEQTTIEAKGTNVTQARADEALIKDFREKLGKALEKWLVELCK